MKIKQVLVNKANSIPPHSQTFSPLPYWRENIVNDKKEVICPVNAHISQVKETCCMRASLANQLTLF